MSVNWKICDECNHKVNIVAKKCPYCNNDSFKLFETGNYPIKDEINELYEYCDLIDNRRGYDKNITPILADFKSGNESVKNQVQIDLANFLTYIGLEDQSSHNGNAFIKEVLDYNPVGNACNEFASLPLSFKLLYENDLFPRNFLEKKNLKGYTSKLYEIYRSLGSVYLNSFDSNIKHQRAFEKYMDELTAFFIDFKNAYENGSYFNQSSNQESIDMVLSTICQNLKTRIFT